MLLLLLELVSHLLIIDAQSARTTVEQPLQVDVLAGSSGEDVAT
jgi:hypothetical protein